MSIMMDIVGSFIIGGLLLLAVMSAYTNINEYAITSSMELTVQGNLGEWTQIIQHDFRKIGYRAPNPAGAIQACDSVSISFLSDIDNNGILDSVSYVLTNPNYMAGTLNPRDRALYRIVSGQASGGSLGLTDFRLRYFDATGNPTFTPSAVKAIEVTLQVESSFPLDTTYVRTNWRRLIYPLNLQ